MLAGRVVADKFVALADQGSGLVNAGIWKDPEHVRQLIGDSAAERFNMALRDTPQLVFELVERFDMQCHAVRCGTVHIAHAAGGMTYLEERYRQLDALGAEVELVDGERASAISGSPVYRHGGILHPGAGTIQPLSYARSLAAAAIAQGAQLYEHSAIETLYQQGDRWLATTPAGQVSADFEVFGLGWSKLIGFGASQTRLALSSLKHQPTL